MKNLFHSQSAKVQNQKNKFIHIMVDQDFEKELIFGTFDKKVDLDYVDPKNPRGITVTSAVTKETTEAVQNVQQGPPLAWEYSD